MVNAKSKKTYRATDMEMYGMLKSLIEDEGYDLESAADRLRNELDEAVIEYEVKDDE